MPRRPSSTRQQTKTTFSQFAQRRKQDVYINQKQSLALMKNVLRSGLASIASTRGLFPEDAFTNRKINGQTVKFLKPGKHPDASLLHKWLERGAFEALAKRYLDTVTFAIHAQDGTKIEDCTLLESYDFNIEYPEDGKEARLEMKKIVADRHVGRSLLRCTPEEAQNATKSMIKKIVAMASTMRPLPQKRYLSMQLTYRDQITPKSYEPNYFRKVTLEQIFAFPSSPMITEIGDVETKYHKVNVSISTTEECEVSHTSEEDEPDSNKALADTQETEDLREPIRRTQETDMSAFEELPHRISDAYEQQYQNLISELENLEKPTIKDKDLFSRLKGRVQASKFQCLLQELVENGKLIRLHGKLRGWYKIPGKAQSSRAKKSRRRKRTPKENSDLQTVPLSQSSLQPSQRRRVSRAESILQRY